MALKQAINEGLIPGPRLLAASRDICATGGMADWTSDWNAAIGVIDCR